MQLVELRVREIQWSREQGHPVLVLEVAGEIGGELTIVISPGDAQMLAAKPAVVAQERIRLIGLIEGLANAMRTPLSGIHFRLDPGMVLTADLNFGDEPDRIALSANFADAVVLATRAQAPMTISRQDLRWIRAIKDPATAQRQEPDHRLATAINSFIESLQLDDLNGPQATG